MEEIDEIAHTKNTYIFVTDHNTVEGHREYRSDKIGAGIEVTTKSGVDIIICGNHQDILALFDNELDGLQDPTNPLYGEMDISAANLVGIAKEMGHEIILPHVGTVQGALMLPEKEQEELARKDVLVEYNGRLPRKMNKWAKAFAKKFRLKPIAGGDSHIRAFNQYTSTNSSIKSDKNLSPIEALRMIHKKKRHSMRISTPGILESIATGKQVLKAGGMKILQMAAKYKQRQILRKISKLSYR